MVGLRSTPEDYCSCPPETPARLIADEAYCNVCDKKVKPRSTPSDPTVEVSSLGSGAGSQHDLGSLFPFRCISCGLLHKKPIEWCPAPCNTDLRDSNNRVSSECQPRFARYERVLRDFAFNSPQGRTPEWFHRRAKEALDG